MDLGLRGKVGLVTGGSRGIGREVARRLAAEGCAVSICGRTSETIERTLLELRAHGVNVHGVVADVTAPGEVERFVNESAAALGGVDLVVANVGGSAGLGLLESTPEDWETTFELNLFHAVRAIRAAVPHRQKRGGGSAVTISSISGWKPWPEGAVRRDQGRRDLPGGALAWELGPHAHQSERGQSGLDAVPGRRLGALPGGESGAFLEVRAARVPVGSARYPGGDRRCRGVRPL